MSELEKRPKKERLYKSPLVVTSVTALLFFVLGVNIGNGRIKLEADKLPITSSQQKLPDDLDYSSVEQVYDALRTSYDGELTEDELLNGLKEGLVEATGDQHTEYLSAEEAEEFNEQLNGSFSGIGAELGQENDQIVIIAPLAGYPAEKAGLRPQDVLIKIDDESAFELSVSEAVSKIRGPEGSKVKLTVVRDGAEELTFDIERAQITIPSVTSEVLDGTIGVLTVSRFGDDTSRLAREAAADFKRRGVTGVILDVRGNPGGLLNEAVGLSSLWLEKGTTVLEEKRDGVTIETFRAEGSAPLKGIPTVVLIDEGSASASEIVAGALKDNKAATLMGAKTYGKGSVQQLEDLIAGGVLKVTIARWYTPNGKNIDQEGIDPDKVVERTDEDYASGRDPQLEVAREALKR